MKGTTREVVLDGRGLRAGAAVRVVLRRRSGAVAFSIGREVRVRDARIVDTDRATTIEVLGQRIASVEHLLAAFGGLGVHEGVSIEVTGSEMPLMDGGASTFCEALREIGAEHASGPIEVARSGQIHVGDSLYVFEPGKAVKVSVTIDFEDARVASEASWDGDPEDFYRRIAPARTFAFAHEVDALAQRGLASHVTPESVVVLGDREVLFRGHPFLADEPARHKLLDLVGDLFLHGGPPRGTVRAHRPGHGATRIAMREALEQGIVQSARVISSAPHGRAAS